MLYYITYINKNQNHEGGISFVTSIHRFYEASFGKSLQYTIIRTWAIS